MSLPAEAASTVETVAPGRRASAGAARRARARSTRRCSACRSAARRPRTAAGGPSGAGWLSSTNGRRIQLSTFSCTTSLDSAKLAAASAGSSEVGIGSAAARAHRGAGQQQRRRRPRAPRSRRARSACVRRGPTRSAADWGPAGAASGPASASAASDPGRGRADAGRVWRASHDVMRLPRAPLTQTGRLVMGAPFTEEEGCGAPVGEWRASVRRDISCIPSAVAFQTNAQLNLHSKLSKMSACRPFALGFAAHHGARDVR